MLSAFCPSLPRSPARMMAAAACSTLARPQHALLKEVAVHEIQIEVAVVIEHLVHLRFGRRVDQDERVSAPFVREREEPQDRIEVAAIAAQHDMVLGLDLLQTPALLDLTSREDRRDRSRKHGHHAHSDQTEHQRQRSAERRQGRVVAVPRGRERDDGPVEDVQDTAVEVLSVGRQALGEADDERGNGEQTEEEHREERNVLAPEIAPEPRPAQAPHSAPGARGLTELPESLAESGEHVPTPLLSVGRLGTEFEQPLRWPGAARAA